MSEVFNQVYEVVCSIPKGKVLTYGLISNLIEGRLSAQGVGWALNALSGSEKQKHNSNTVPWHRVINSRGFTSTQKRGDMPPDLQRRLLEAEGVEFSEEGKVDLDKYLWKEGLLL